MPNIKLQTSDNEIFDIDIQLAKCFGTIKTMLEDCGMEDDSNTVVPLSNVHSYIFRKVLEWAEYHKNDLKPVESISPWDADFLKVDQSTLYGLMLAANYLDIKGLMDVACMTVAKMIRGKSAEENRRMFNITNDFTPAEEEEIRRENNWCEELSRSSC